MACVVVCFDAELTIMEHNLLPTVRPSPTAAQADPNMRSLSPMSQINYHWIIQPITDPCATRPSLVPDHNYSARFLWLPYPSPMATMYGTCACCTISTMLLKPFCCCFLEFLLRLWFVACAHSLYKVKISQISCSVDDVR